MLMEHMEVDTFGIGTTCYRSFVLEGPAQSAYDICQLSVVAENRFQSIDRAGEGCNGR